MGQISLTLNGEIVCCSQMCGYHQDVVLYERTLYFDILIGLIDKLICKIYRMHVKLAINLYLNTLLKSSMARDSVILIYAIANGGVLIYSTSIFVYGNLSLLTSQFRMLFWVMQGPRVIVVGPTDSGKSTLARMLLSWAAKQGWKPTFVDLDIGQGSITIPGCISATPIELPIDPVEGVPLEMPLVYFFGHVTPR